MNTKLPAAQFNNILSKWCCYPVVTDYFTLRRVSSGSRKCSTMKRSSILQAMFLELNPVTGWTSHVISTVPHSSLVQAVTFPLQTLRLLRTMHFPRELSPLPRLLHSVSASHHRNHPAGVTGKRKGVIHTADQWDGIGGNVRNEHSI